MTKTLRLSKKEQESVKKKCAELNKFLVGKNMEVLSESDVLHFALKNQIEKIEISENGLMFLDCCERTKKEQKKPEDIF